jgi:hypothetical protein
LLWSFDTFVKQLVRYQLATPGVFRMLHNINRDAQDGSTCVLTYEENEQWLQAVWSGYIDPTEALHGAEAYLQHAGQHPCAFLLNDNSQLRGPWFESTDWLVDVWVPQAQQLGLRYVAHIVQADQHYDVLTLRLSTTTTTPFELQIFQDGVDARQWLRQVRDAHLNLAP